MMIRKAASGEYEKVRGFYHSMIDAMAAAPKVYVAWKKDVYPSPELISGSIEKGEMYLALEGDEIAGAMVLNHDPGEGYAGVARQTEADDAEVMVIHALGVHPEHAGKGYAKALVREAVGIAGRTGMKAIRLDVLHGNLPAERLYTGLGFRSIEKVRMYYEDTGLTEFSLYEYVI